MSDKPFKKLPTNKEVIGRFLYYLKVDKYTVKQPMSESYDEVIAVWKKVADGAASAHTCYMSRKTVLKRLNDLNKMLKRAENPKSARSHREKWHLSVDKLFDRSKMILKTIFAKKTSKSYKIRKGHVKLLLVVKTFRQTNQKTSIQRRIYSKTSKRLRI